MLALVLETSRASTRLEAEKVCHRSHTAQWCSPCHRRYMRARNPETTHARRATRSKRRT